MMKNNISHQIMLNDKQIEFLVKCIDLSSSGQSMKPDLNEVELIRELTKINDLIQEDKYGQTHAWADSIYHDLT